MAKIQKPFTVHEAEVAVFHAWGDGMRSAGPTPRHLTQPAGESFRAGLRISQAEGAAAGVGGFGEWRLHAPWPVSDGAWLVEMSAPLGTVWDDGAQVAALLPPGVPSIIVVRFRCRDTGVWRVYQFHDAVALPGDAGEDSQKVTRALRFSAGWLEEYKSGTMPALEPRVRGVIEWRHLGRVVRCWEYDADANTWAEDAENLTTMEGHAVRHVSLDWTGADVAVSMLAAVTQETATAGLQGVRIGWMDVQVFEVNAAAGLVLAPGWVLEAQGCAEPLLLPESGRHWEHPRVVFRVLGRTHATARAGTFAMPSMNQGTPDMPMDIPLRLGRLVLYPDGGWILD